MISTDRPNLLFIFTDEQRLDTLACYGNERIHMPHINRLAAEGCVFEEPYCVSPVCTPSRGTLMTGLYPHQHGAFTNNLPMHTGARTLPELLPPEVRRDYVAGYHGKWHLGDEIFRQHGFDQWVSIEDLYFPHFGEGRDRKARSDYHHHLIGQGFTLGIRDYFPRDFSSQLPERYGKPQFLADHASRFLRENRDRPFMLYVNFLEPHMPFHGPRNHQYLPKSMVLPANHQDTPRPDAPLWYRLLAERFRRHGHGGFRLQDEQDWREMMARYWGLCSLVDTHVGRILQALRESGLEDRTIVVFTSDHGDMMGSHGLLAKCVMYREATRVPLIVRLPGQTKGGRISGPISHIDLVPTLLDLMGQAPDPALPGTSLAPIIQTAAANGDGNAQGVASPVMIQWYGRDEINGATSSAVPEWMPEHTDKTADQCLTSSTADRRAMVSPGGYRFTSSVAGDHELYDLGQDPLETTNLVAVPEHRETTLRLLSELRVWQRKVQDPLALPDL